MSFGDGFFLAVALLLIAFYGEPDIADAIVHRLMGADALGVAADR